MDTTILIIVIAAAVVLVGAVLIVAMRRRARTGELHDRFGSEWERTVGTADGRGERRAARHDLAERAEKRDELEIHPLDVAARQQYSDQWRSTQARFVDEPQAALSEAEQLLDAVMREQGYPVDGFEQQASLISVDHPDVVENYRGAHAMQDRARHGQATTEDLREAMLRYRSLFDELLSPV
jgi:hypothetical protein